MFSPIVLARRFHLAAASRQPGSLKGWGAGKWLAAWALVGQLPFPAFAFDTEASELEMSRFICTSVDQNARIEVEFEHRQDFRGGLHARKMVVKDPTVSVRNQLVATFLAADGLLSNADGRVIAHVDLNNPSSSRRGERIGGTVLGALRSISLEIDFSYQELVEDLSNWAAQVIYTKRNDKELIQDFDCKRSVTFRL